VKQHIAINQFNVLMGSVSFTFTSTMLYNFTSTRLCLCIGQVLYDMPLKPKFNSSQVMPGERYASCCFYFQPLPIPSRRRPKTPRSKKSPGPAGRSPLLFFKQYAFSHVSLSGPPEGFGLSWGQVSKVKVSTAIPPHTTTVSRVNTPPPLT
jgi:hypothetical protein